MKKLVYLIVVIVALGLIVVGCNPVVPPVGQNESGALPNKGSDLNIPVTINAAGRTPLVGTITADGNSIIFDIRAVGQADDGDSINPSKWYTQRQFGNEYFSISAAGKFLKYNMWGGNTNPYWGTNWFDATSPLPEGVTFSQVEDGDDFVYAVSMSYAILGISEGDTFPVQIKARDFNDDYVQSYSGYEGYNGEYSFYNGLYITDTGVLEVTLPKPVIKVEIDIKPSSDPNSINLGSKGVVPVAVLTTDNFDASSVNPITVEFAGASPVRWTMEDVDSDGDLDMLFHFKTQDLVLDEDSTEATLIGETNSGNPIKGTDTVNIVPKK